MSARFLPLAALAVAASAGVAPAQYFPRFGPNVPVGFYANTMFGGYYFNTYRTYQYSVTGYVNGSPTTLNYQYFYSGMPRSNNYYYFAPNYGYPYSPMSGSVGSYGSDSNNPLVNRQRAALARAQQAMDGNNPVAGGGKDDIAKWVAAQDRGGDPAGPPPLIDPALIDPPAEAILSGRTLNELATLCRAQEKAGRKADSGLCPPDLLEKVVFEGGPAAAVNLFRKASLPYPKVLLVPETEKLRAAIDAEFAAVGQALKAGRQPNFGRIDRLDASVTLARQEFHERTKAAPFADAKAVNDFLTQLVQAVKFARTPAAATALPASWNTTGATVAELLAYMTKHKMQFGPAATGGESAYLSLHRGLLGYFVRLTPVKPAKK